MCSAKGAGKGKQIILKFRTPKNSRFLKVAANAWPQLECKETILWWTTADYGVSRPFQILARKFQKNI